MDVIRLWYMDRVRLTAPLPACAANEATVKAEMLRKKNKGAPLTDQLLKVSTRSFNSLPHRKKGRRLERTITDSPVLGLRPL